MAEGRAGQRLREVADRLDAMGEDFKGKAQAAIERTIARLEGLTDKAEAGDEITDEEAAADEGAHVDNTLPEGEGEEPPKATQLPAS